MVRATSLAQLRRPGGRLRAWLGLVLALALVLKLLVPQGWMPGPGGTLVLCPGSGPVAASTMHHGGGKHGAPGHEAPDHPCAFGGLGLAAVPTPALPDLAAPALQATPPAISRGTVAIGQGLAAPPPPATGPPAFA